jgi:predicted N-formylglutamate amidohydrolase
MVHSFCPGYGSEPRDFDIGLLYDPSRIAESETCAKLERALCDAGFEVQHNQPYPGTGDGINTYFRNILPLDYVPVELEINERLLLAPNVLERLAAVTSALLLTRVR